VGRGGGRREKGRERLGKGGGRKIGKKGEKLDKVYLGAQECHFLQPALCAGRRAYSFVKSGPNFKDEQFIWKKKKKKRYVQDAQQGSRESVHLKAKNVRWWRGRKYLFKSARPLCFPSSKSLRAAQIL
jgi:hypothetical protein